MKVYSPTSWTDRRHPMRWEGEKLLSEYEYHVAGAYRLARRTMAPKRHDAWQWTIEDLVDDKVAMVIDRVT